MWDPGDRGARTREARAAQDEVKGTQGVCLALGMQGPSPAVAEPRAVDRCLQRGKWLNT